MDNKTCTSDLERFNNLKPPFSPNVDEVEIYNEYCTDKNHTKTLLLGYTKELMHLCSDAMDINPPDDVISPSGLKVIKQDWFTITEYYDTIIGDGVLNLVGGDLVQYLSKYCNTLIIRFFTEKFSFMRYATHFRNNTSFLLPDIIINTQPQCKILIWKFKN